MIYLIVIVLLFVGLHFDNKDWKNRSKNIWWYFELIVLILLAGLRYRVGGDSLGYDDMHAHMETLSQLFNLKELSDWADLRYMPLWHYFVALCLEVTDDFIFLQIVESIFVNSVIFWFVKKYANRPFMVVLFYFVMMYPYYNTEILRQIISVCVFLLAIPSLLAGKYVRFYLLAILALGFHHASVFLFIVPPVFIFMKKMGDKSMVGFMLIFIIGMIFVSQLDLVSTLMKLWGMSQVGSAMSHNDVNHTSFVGVIYRLITEWLLTFLFLFLCKYQNKEDRAMLSIYVFISGIAIPVFLMYRIVDFMWIPFYVIIMNNLDRFYLSRRTMQKLRIKNYRLYGLLSILVVLNVLIVRFNYYMLDRYEITGMRDSYQYNMYIPYHSVFDQEKDDKREALHYNDAFTE